MPLTHFLLATQRGLVISLLGSVALIDLFIVLFCFPSRNQPAQAAPAASAVVRLQASLRP